MSRNVNNAAMKEILPYGIRTTIPRTGERRPSSLRDSNRPGAMAARWADGFSVASAQDDVARDSG